MGMIYCYECKQKISDSAKTCPKCGAKQKTKSNNSVLARIAITIVLIGVGALLYIFKDSIFGSKDDSSKINIPNGRYVLMKNDDKGFNKVRRLFEQASAGIKGLGNQLTVIGDSVQSSDLFTNLTGGPTTFAIEKTNADNMFYLDLPGNRLSMELTSQQRLRIYVGSSDSLVYQKQ